LIVSWVDTAAISQPETFTIQMSTLVKRETRTITDVQVVNLAVEVVPATAMWILFTLENLNTDPLTSFSAILIADASETDITIGYPTGSYSTVSDAATLDTSTLVNSDSSFVRFEVTANTLGTFTLTLRMNYQKSGQSITVDQPISLTVRNGGCVIVDRRWSVRNNGDTYVGVPFELDQPLTKDITLTPNSLPAGFTMKSLTQGTKGYTSYVANMLISVGDVAPGTYPLVMTFTVQTGEDENTIVNDIEKELTFVVYQAPDDKAADGFSDIFGANGKVIPAIAISIVVVVGVMAAAAAVIAYFVLRKTRANVRPFKPFSDMEKK